MSQIEERKKHSKKVEEYLNYKVIFQERKVELTADIDTYEYIKNEIMKLVSLEKAEC